MAAAASLTTRSPVTHSEMPRSNPQTVAEQTALKANCYVCAAYPLKGAVCIAYAQGKLTTFEANASLQFSVDNKLPEEMCDFFDKIREGIPENVDQFPSKNDFWPCYSYPADALELTQVSTVIVNIQCLSALLEESPIISAIGCFCKRAFIHMDSSQSAVNVHSGFEHWRADSILAPRSDIRLKIK